MPLIMQSQKGKLHQLVLPYPDFPKILNKSYQHPFPVPSKAVVFVVVLSLLVILIYGSVAKSEVFAKPPKLGPITCHTGQGLPPGQTECCQPTLSSVTGRVLLVFCTTCDDTNPPSNCSPRYLTTAGAARTNALPPSGNNTGPITNGQTGLPTPAGSVLPPSGDKTGKTSIFNPVRNVTSVLPGNNNTGNSIAMTTSDNPPGCSTKNPIPPNCTLNPFNNSASNKAGTVGSATNPSNTTGTASLGNIIKVPVNHTNSLPTGNNTSTPPPALKLSQPSLPGQQQQTTAHHHKGSNTGASTSTGSNSTSH
jgi:hypothetical protein